MQDLNDKASGSTLTADEWNQLPSEIQNAIESLGITLSGADLHQLGKAIAGYVANGDFYTDSGAANAYVLTQIGLKKAPTAYTDGMRVRFIPGNMNTGASTVNVATLGLKDLRDELGNALVEGDLSTVVAVTFAYNTSAGHFRRTSSEPVTRTAPITVTHNMASDADYTLTATQEQYGRIVITDTGPVLTTGRNIVCSKARRSYTVVNSAAQSLTFKTSAGSGVTIGSGNTVDAYCDGTNVINVLPTLVVGHGQCELEYVSTTQLKLSRKDGKYLTINGQVETIPSAGVTLANTGLTAATLYYIYAYMSAGTMTLEAIATAYSADTTTGVQIKTGDATRTLVGVAYMDAGVPGTFASSNTKRYVRSWFNDKTPRGLSAFTANRTTASTTYVELNTEIRVNFVAWAGETICCAAHGTVENTTTGAQVSSTGIGIDSATPELNLRQAGTSGSTGVTLPAAIGVTGPFTATEGLHYATLCGRVDTATGRWIGVETTSGAACYLTVSFSHNG